MADNYLENKMEEHRRIMSAPKRRTGNTITQKGLAEAIGWNCPCILIRIDGSDMRLLAPIAGTLRQASCRVAFICTDALAGRELAQRTGAMHIPFDDMARANALLESRRMNPDFCIEGSADTLKISGRHRSWSIRRTATTDADCFAGKAAHLCVYLALPLSESLAPEVIHI